ncbi:MAG: hypothetical protein V7675_16805 [Hyphomonas sp.]|uniref:hypothetical protein n=1 Tax=Hyphomonas sp. TaxID=87 RepID=UPI00300302AF
MITIAGRAYDKVIQSNVCQGETNYEQALNMFLPLIDEFDSQRKIQNKKFYERLKRDIIDGCLMPPITIALVSKEHSRENAEGLEEYINAEIGHGYILDGLQRINTLRAASEELGFDRTRPLPLSVIISPSEDQLVYRMITLNNGQRPMTARHQIEILTGSIFEQRQYKNISIKTEKDTEGKRYKNAMPLANVAKAYISHMTQATTNENRKIIEEKMDEILVGRILDRGFSSEMNDFEHVVELIDRLCSAPEVFNWFKVENNIIAFAAAVQSSFDSISAASPEEFGQAVTLFERAFDGFNVSKLNVGRLRRQLALEFIARYEKLSQFSESELLEHFSEMTAA